jgi:vancomycin resistance protein YoaR
MKQQRTKVQNRAMHKLFTELGNKLNELGLDARLILKDNYQIWWTPEMIKRDLWKPLQKAMLNKEHTADLYTDEVSKVYEQLAKIIGEKRGVEIEFPSQLQTKEYLSSLEKSYDKTI